MKTPKSVKALRQKFGAQLDSLEAYIKTLPLDDEIACLIYVGDLVEKWKDHADECSSKEFGKRLGAAVEQWNRDPEAANRFPISSRPRQTQKGKRQ